MNEDAVSVCSCEGMVGECEAPVNEGVVCVAAMKERVESGWRRMW